MGGYGSTRWNTHYKKTTVEECKTLPISLLKKSIKYVVENQGESWSGSVSWSYNNEPAGNIGYMVYSENDYPNVRLQYKFTDSGLEMDYPISLSHSELAWGAKRWWFICPLTKNGVVCNQRVGKLYLPPGGEYFGCRYCYNLTYSSCQESHKYDSFYKHFTHRMNETIPGFSSGEAKKALDSLEGRWEDESAFELVNRRIIELEEKEQKKKERLAKYLTADELCRQSGLTKEELGKLEEYRLLVPDTKDGRYRPKLVGWGKKLKGKKNKGLSANEIKNWTRERWNK